MNESGVSFGIARRLGLIAALLAALAAGNSHGASLDLHEYSTAPTWEGSDASVTRADVASTNHRAAEVALAEVRTTRSILETTRELLVAPGFDEFLDHVGLALDAYEASPRKPEHLTVLATSLAVARASLQGRATSLPHWAAVARSAGATSTRYVRVPDRFVETFTVARETAQLPRLRGNLRVRPHRRGLMPIVVPAVEGAPLSQGDILRNVPFVAVGVDGNAVLDPSVPFVLVLSRPCKALRDDVVVVAPVVPYPLDLAEVAKGSTSPVGGLERMRRFLAGLRDGIKGGDFSDALYLGAFEEGGTKRFAVQLTSLCTARVPTELDQREGWLKTHRVACLDVEFLRDLHTRVVLTFTRLGFDDHAWYSNADLDVMVSAGEAEVAHLKSDLVAAEQAIQQKLAANRPASKEQTEALDRKRTGLEEAEAKLKPYLEQRALRRPA